MFMWVILLFGLGIAAFFDSIYNFGEIFGQVNSVIFLLIAVGLLARVTTQIKRGRIENFQVRVEKLEQDIKTLVNQNQPLDF